MSGLGLVHLYTGEGKGKTTAAVGLAVRAAGRGIPVVFLQFMKNRPSGEINVLTKLPGVTVLRGKAGEGFTFTMTSEEKAESRRIHGENLRRAIELAEAGECGLLVLDEAASALNCGLLEEELLRGFLHRRPPGVEVVLTGRNPPAWLAERADYITEMRKVRHPYDKGVAARPGIEE